MARSRRTRRKGRHKRAKFYGLNIISAPYTSDEAEFLEASDIKNIRLTEHTGIETKLGRAYNIATAHNYPIHSEYWFRDKENGDHFVYTAGNEIYDDGAAAGSPSLSYTLPTYEQKAFYSSMKGFLFYTDGTNNLKFDGTDWTPIGVTTPTTAAFATATVAAGSLTGTYVYAYTYVYKNAGLSYESESAFSTLSSEVTVSAKDIEVTVVASSETHVSNIRVYRASQNYADWQLQGEYANTTATITDSTLDDDLGDIPVAVFEGKPPVLKGTVAWKNRLFGWGDAANPSKIYMSKIEMPERFYLSDNPDFIPFSCDSDNKESVKLVTVAFDRLVIHTDTKFYEIIGNDESDFKVIWKYNTGIKAPRSAKFCEDNKYRWLAPGGVYSWDGYSAPEHISEHVDKDSEGASRGILDTTSTYLENACAMWMRDSREYRLSVPFSENRFNTRTFVYFTDLSKRNSRGLSQWGLDDYGFDAEAESPDQIHYTSDSSGKYTREDFGTQDNGADINSYYVTKQTDFDEAGMDKRGDSIVATAGTLGVIVSCYVMYDNNRIAQLFLINPPDEAVFDVDKFNECRWAGFAKITRKVSSIQEGIGEFVSFKFEGTGVWKLYKFHFTYTPEGKESV